MTRDEIESNELRILINRYNLTHNLFYLCEVFKILQRILRREGLIAKSQHRLTRDVLRFGRTIKDFNEFMS